jgi:hypothetical protein
VTTTHKRTNQSDTTRNFKRFRLLITPPNGQQQKVDASNKKVLRSAISKAIAAGATRIEEQRHTAYGAYETVRTIDPTPDGEVAS